MTEAGGPAFELRCGGQCGVWGTAGVLSIAPGSVRFEFVVLQRLLHLPSVVEAREPPVLLRARLLPPGLNSALVIRDGAVTVSVLTWWGHAGSVRAALDAAEIDYQSRETRLSIGFLEGVRGHPRHWWL